MDVLAGIQFLQEQGIESIAPVRTFFGERSRDSGGG
jgi:hypothetical protein